MIDPGITVSTRVLDNGEEYRVDIDKYELGIRELLVKRIQFGRHLRIEEASSLIFGFGAVPSRASR